MSMVRRIAVSTGGGDAPGLNAVIRAVVKASTSRGWEVFGVRDGLDGFFQDEPEGMVRLTNEAVRGILPRGGTILGTTNRGNPFAHKVIENGAVRVVDRSDDVIRGMRNRGLDVLVLIGGDGSLRIGHELVQLGLQVVGVPKTIDNDLDATEVTFGFDTALTTATDAIDKLHSTAESHHRVMILEVMGRDAGWIALHSGIAGGADVILIPEIPFSLERVAAHIEARRQRKQLFSIVVVAEGTRPPGEGAVYLPSSEGSGVPRLGGIGHWLANALAPFVVHEVRVTTLGHLQRGGSPTARDRILASRFGTRAVDLIEAGLTRHMVALQADQVVAVPLADCIARPKLVPPDGELVRTAEALGISFGKA